MTQTKAGAVKAVTTIKTKHGADFFARIGQIGGQNGTTGGFYANRELAKTAGAKGGRRSRRGPWSEAERQTRMERFAPKETLFADDSILVDEDFGDGFFRPTLKQRMLNKIRSL